MANPDSQTRQPSWLKRYGKPAVVTALCVVIGLLVLSSVARMSATRIAHNERAWFEAQIKTLVPPASFDNDLLLDKTLVIAPETLGTRNPVAVYRARLKGMPTAVIINSVAPDGYGGPIELLVAISYDGEILGVHVLAHHETPGMGNDFELPDSTWLDAFRGRSLNNPQPRGWNVHKDGGEFEQFTSATVSPRAIIQAVQRTLNYYQDHRNMLFEAPVK